MKSKAYQEFLKSESFPKKNYYKLTPKEIEFNSINWNKFISEKNEIYSSIVDLITAAWAFYLVLLLLTDRTEQDKMIIQIVASGVSLSAIFAVKIISIFTSSLQNLLDRYFEFVYKKQFNFLKIIIVIFILTLSLIPVMFWFEEYFLWYLYGYFVVVGVLAGIFHSLRLISGFSLIRF